MARKTDKKSSIRKDIIDASVSKYTDLLVKDNKKVIPESIRHLIKDSFYS